MRDADFLPRADDQGFHTLLLVSHHGDGAVTGLLARAGAAATVCTPADVAAVLGHLAIDVVMVLDDVSAAERSLIDVEAARHATSVLAGPAPAAVEPWIATTPVAVRAAA